MAPESPVPDPHPAGALPVGARLGEFEVRRVLGIGGFGIVYHAFDHQLERDVAVKEYMPASLAGRTETMHVSLLSQSHADTFALGLRSFINEARLLARFDHPSLVKVYRFWEENSTAYMAMPLYRGQTLKAVRLAMAGSPDEAWLRTVLEPLLGAIDRLHQEGVYHRDIAPDNILIEADGHPVLLDFGAARRVITDKSQNLTAILKPSYAPIEQYGEAGSVRQGPWTDLYALGATMHFLLLGRPPIPAPARAVEDEARPLASMPLAGCSPVLLQLIDWMLAPRPADRPQDVAAVRQVLSGTSVPPIVASSAPQTPEPWERTQILGPGVTQTLVTPRTQPAALERTIVDPKPTVSMPAAPSGAPTADDETTQPRPPAATQPPAVAIAASPALEQVPPPGEAMAPRRSWLPAAAAAAVVAVGGAWFALKPAAPTSPVAAALPTPSVPMVTASQPLAQAAAQTPAPAATASAVTETAVAVAPPPSSLAAAPAPSRAAVGQVKPAAPRPPPATAPPGQSAATKPPGRPLESTPRPAETTVATPGATSPVSESPTSTTPVARAAVTPPPVVDTGKPGVESDSAQSPSESCRKQLAVLKWVCMDVQCGRSRFVNHPECLKLRADQERARAAANR